MQKYDDLNLNQKVLQDKYMKAKKGYHLLSASIQTAKAERNEACNKLVQMETDYYPLKEKSENFET